MPDFFLDEFLEYTGKQAAAAPAAAAPAAGAGGAVEQVFAAITSMLSPEIVQKTNAVFAFEVKGKEEGKWFLDLKTGAGAAGRGEPAAGADATLIMDTDNFVKMFAGVSPCFVYVCVCVNRVFSN